MISSQSNTYKNTVDRSPFSIIGYEISLSFQFIRYDLTTTIFPATLLLLAVCFAYVDPVYWLPNIAKSIVYFWLYIYIFALSNQYVGYEEDCINKPTRPLPSGLISMEGAELRFYVASLIFMLVGLFSGVAEWALLWLVATILHNWLKWSWHWLGKNFLMGVGVFSQLAAAWQIAHPLNDVGFRWILMMSILLFFVVAVQDLRDLDGDRAIGRLTLPMVFGEVPSRWYLSLAILIMPFIVLMAVVPSTGMSLIALIHFLIMASMCFVLALRVVLKRNVQADRFSYEWLTYWYMVVLGLAIWLL